jgi:hypothetical protein
MNYFEKKMILLVFAAVQRVLTIRPARWRSR